MIGMAGCGWSGPRFGISRARFGIRDRSGTSLRTKKSFGGLCSTVSVFVVVSTDVFSFETESILKRKLSNTPNQTRDMRVIEENQ